MKHIRIIAGCDAFSTDEVVSEKKAEKRLDEIRTLFGYAQRHYGESVAGPLKVKTFVVNPELPLR